MGNNNEKTETISKIENIKKTLFFTPDITPRSSKTNDNCSEDVFIMDEFGMNGLAFYDFVEKKWCFLTDTLVDYDEDNNPTNWKWYYPTFSFFDIFPEKLNIYK